MTFLRRCGCEIDGACRIAGQRVTWCTEAAAGAAGRETRSAMWAAVMAGDHVRGRDGAWWAVELHDAAGRIRLRGPGGAVAWGKRTPSAWEVARGWFAVDPAGRVELLAGRETMGAPGQLTAEQAVAVVTYALGGRVVAE